MPLHSCTGRIQWITSDGLNAHELVPSKRSSKIAPLPPGPRSPPLATELPSIPGQSLLQLHRPLKCHYCAPTQPTKAVRLSEASKARTHTDWSDNLCDSPPAPFPPSLFPINLLIPPFPPMRTHTHVCEQVTLPRLPLLCTKHQSVFGVGTLSPLSNLQVSMKAATVALDPRLTTPRPGTGTADKDPVWEWGMRTGSKSEGPTLKLMSEEVVQLLGSPVHGE